MEVQKGSMMKLVPAAKILGISDVSVFLWIAQKKLRSAVKRTFGKRCYWEVNEREIAEIKQLKDQYGNRWWWFAHWNPNAYATTSQTNGSNSMPQLT